MQRLRLLLSINSSWNVVNFRSGLVKALIAEGYDVIVAAPDEGHSEAIEAMGCRFVPLRLSGRGISPVDDLQLYRQYRRVLRRERPHAFLGYTIKPNVYGSMAAHRLGIPVVNNIAGLGTAFLRRGWLNRLVRMLYRQALRRSRIIFFQNPDDRDLFVRDRLVDPARVRLLPGSGVDLERFSPQSGSKRAGTRFLLVSRLLWAKGITEYVDAADDVRRDHPETSFSILGILDESDGAVDRSSIERWHQEGKINYLGAAADVRPVLAEADCLVLPSYYPEGTPRALLEGAAMALPLITTNVPGCRMVVDDGVNGFLCVPRDWRALGDAIRRFISLSPDKRLAMGQASRDKAERVFDEQIVVTAYLAAISDVVGPCLLKPQ